MTSQGSRRIGFAGLAATLLWASPLLAQPQPAADAQLVIAREVVEASGAAAGLKEIVPIFLDEAKRTFVRTRPELSKDLDAAIKIIQPEFERRREQLLMEVASVYAQRFTAQELADIKAFYLTPAGLKLVNVLPGILQASYEKTNVWSRQMSQEVVTRLRDEMKKKGHDI